MIENKSWYRSRTIWGGVVALGAALAGLLGMEIDNGMGTSLTDALVDAAAAAGALIAILGRLDAKSTIG